MLGLVAVRNGFELTSGIVSGIDFWTQSNLKYLIGKVKRVPESIPITRSNRKAAPRFRGAVFSCRAAVAVRTWNRPYPPRPPRAARVPNPAP